MTRIRSWLIALLTAIASFFGFVPRLGLPAGRPLEQAAQLLDRAQARREFREFNRSRYAVIPPFHKVNGKTRAVLRRPQTI